MVVIVEKRQTIYKVWSCIGKVMYINYTNQRLSAFQTKTICILIKTHTDKYETEEEDLMLFVFVLFIKKSLKTSLGN